MLVTWRLLIVKIILVYTSELITRHPKIVKNHEQFEGILTKLSNQKTIKVLIYKYIDSTIHLNL